MAIPNVPPTQGNQNDPNPANPAPVPNPTANQSPSPDNNPDVNRLVPEPAAPTTPNVNPPTMPAETAPGMNEAQTVPPSPVVPGANDTMTEMDNPSLSTAQSVAPEPVSNSMPEPVPSTIPEPPSMNTAPVEPNIEMNTLPPISTPTEVTEPGMPEAPAVKEEKHETIAHTGVLDQFSSPADAGAENPLPDSPTPAPVETPTEDTSSGASKILPFVVLIAAFIALLALIYYFFL